MICVGQKSRQLWLKSAAGAPLGRMQRQQDMLGPIQGTETVEMYEPYAYVGANQQLAIPVAAWSQ